MEAPDSTFDPRRLAEQTEWLRRLARRLVSDVDLAEDVVQDTLLATLQRPPRNPVSESGLRSWMIGVAQNVARMRRRAHGRRLARETMYAEDRDGTAPSSGDVVERTSQARRLLDAVLALDEPYRSAVLLAYEEQLPSRAVAERMGVTPEAARKRVSRGLARLRERLGEEDGARGGTRRAGLAALVDGGARLEPALWAGGLTMSMKIVWSVAACTLLLVLGFIAASEAPTRTPRIESEVRQTAAAELAAAALQDAGPTPIEHGEGRRASSALASPSAPAPAARTIRGRFLLSDGLTPVAGARLRAADHEQRTSAPRPSGVVVGETDARGHFELTLAADDPVSRLAAGLWAEHEDVYDVHVDPSEIPASDAEALEIRTVRLGRVEVRVRAEDGSPLPGVDIDYMLDPTIGSDAQLWGHRRDIVAGTSDATGNLTVDRLPVSMLIRFGVRGEYRDPGRVMIDPVLREAEVVVTPQPWSGIHARLEWPGGAPAAGVSATWHGTPGRSGAFAGVSATSDAAGELWVKDVAEGGGVLIFPDGGYHAPVHLRLEPGEVAELGVLAIARRVAVTGRVAADPNDGPVDGLGVAAFRDGFLAAYQPLAPGRSEFELMVPAGDVVLAATRGMNWDPELPYRGTDLGEVVVDAPADGVELPLRARTAAVTGRIETGSGDVELIVFDPNPSVDWGYAADVTGSRRTASLAEDGSFRCTVDATDSARVLLVLGDGRTAYSPPVALVAGQETDLGDLRTVTGRLEARVAGEEVEGRSGVTVEVGRFDREAKSERTDADGRASFELAAGPYAIRADTDGSTSGAWRVVHVESGRATTAEIELAGNGLLEGIVVSPAGPASGVTLKTQREVPPTNLSWSATTGPDGRFEFQPLTPGTYRYWISGHLVGRVELRAGEPADLSLSIDRPRQAVEVVRGGEPIPYVESLLVAARNEYPKVWRRAERALDGRFLVALPEGPLLFQVGFGGLGNNQIGLVPGPASSGADYALELPGTGVELRLEGASAQRPNPAARFVDLEGVPLESSWGAGSEVYAEATGGQNGVPARSVRFPFLAPGTQIRIEGSAEAGGRASRDVTVQPGGWTVIDW